MKKNYKFKKFIKNIFLLKEKPLKLKRFTRLKWKNFKQYVKRTNLKAKKRINLKKFKKEKNLKYKKKYKFNKHSYKKYKYKKREVRLINILILKNSLFKWERKKKNFHKNLKSRQTLRFLYGNALNLKYFKKNVPLSKSKLNLIRYFLLKPFFKINILFWILNYCKSTMELKQILSEKKIKLNNKCIQKPVFLKKGDVVSSTFYFTSFEKVNTFPRFKKIFSFIENDFYTGTFVIIKNLTDTKLNDFSLSISNYFHIRNIHNTR